MKKDGNKIPNINPRQMTTLQKTAIAFKIAMVIIQLAAIGYLIVHFFC
jgi:hypothetical protein